MQEVKILILVLGVDREPWKKIETEGQIPTWRMNTPTNMQIVRYVGSDNMNIFWKIVNKGWIFNQKIQSIFRTSFSFLSINPFVRKIMFSGSLLDQELKIRVPDIYSLIGAKTVAAFDLSLQNFNFDYIYRTNVSSYIDLPALNSYIGNKPRINFYAGVIGEYQKIQFASGSGYFISRDLVTEVVRRKEYWDHNLVDDVSLGKFLTQVLDVNIEAVGRVDLNPQYYDLNLIGSKTSYPFHYRCKSSDPNLTINYMKNLHIELNQDI